ncbi:MAG: 50S ribosomal protein L15e [Candidatus Diapherotrites archaeon]|nr:50S ribosomal protein L15e [Candidatus Diapherotrites archaeon]
MGAYQKITENIQKQVKGKTKFHKEALLTARTQPVVMRVERPANLSRARSLGYKAKQGFVVVRVRVKRGSGMHTRPSRGRRPKRMGVNKLTRAKSKQLIAEERAQRKYPNLEVLNSYWVIEDGTYKWYEVIMLDPNNPAIKGDKDFSWILSSKHVGRVHRGKTKAGRKAAGKLSR